MDQPFLQASLCPLSVGVSVWPEDRAGQLLQYSVKTKITMEYVDYTFLGLHHLVKPADVNLWVQHPDSQLDITGKLASINATV